MSLCMCLLIIFLLSSTSCFNFDTDYPIIYDHAQSCNSGLSKSSYFGYSVILHGGERPWIQIGAPNDGIGSVYKCDIRERCSFVTIHSSLQNSTWIGSTMDTLDNYTLVCGFQTETEYNEWCLRRACFLSRPNQIYASLDFGDFNYQLVTRTSISAQLVKTTTGYNVLAGAISVFAGASFAVLNIDVNLNLMTRKKAVEPNNRMHNYGYAVDSGYFFSKIHISYAVSSPKNNFYRGSVYIFNFPFSGEKMNIQKEIQGLQFGEYFGYSLAAGDFNADGYTDLIVGAPFYADRGYNQGRIYVYSGQSLDILQLKETISGYTNGGQFGSAIAYLGDHDKDGYGDIAVSAPYENDFSGAIYIYRGSSRGILSDVSQKITAEHIDPDLRGFGFSFSRAIDIDGNNYTDLAIGSYLSGHVVILRSRPVVNLMQKVHIWGGKFAASGSSVMQVCLRYTGRYVPNNLNTTLEMEIDSTMRRFTVQDDLSDYRNILLTSSVWKCLNFTVTVMKGIDVLTPVPIKILHTLSKVQKKSSPIYVNDTVVHDEYCKECPVVRQSESLEMEVLFALNCGGKDTCESNLLVSAQFVNLNSKHEYILGSNQEVILNIFVNNVGEKAYLTQFTIELPSEVILQQTPTICSEANSSYVICLVGSPVEFNETTVTQLHLDVSRIQHARTLYFRISVSTSSDSKHKLVPTIETLKLISQADFHITGEATQANYSYGSINKGKSDFTKIFEIKKIGLSTIPKVIIDINIPVAVNTSLGTIWFLHMYSHRGVLGDQPITCKNVTYLDYITEAKVDSKSDIASMDNKTREGAKRQRRNIPEASINQSNTSKDDLKNEIESSILELEYKSIDIIHATVRCTAGPFSSHRDLAVIRIKASLNVSVLEPLLTKKNAIRLTTFGNISVPHFQQTGNLSDESYVGAIFFASEIDKNVSVWILIIASLVGLLLLCLFSLGLYKAGFFERKKLTELEALKKSEVESALEADARLSNANHMLEDEDEASDGSL